MPDSPMAKASIDGMRSLTDRELATVRLGLLMVYGAHTGDENFEAARGAAAAVEIISDLDIRSLLYELETCRKVSVCRSNVSRT